jgi:predicted AAA+ superfamily ATPase
MNHFKRLLKLDLPKGQSAFLWGARKTGKSTLLKDLFPDAITYNFLKSDLFIKYAKEPHRFREELEKKKEGAIIVVDEVQKVPALLDEIHYLIESTDHQFIMCGSSARKVKRAGVNMLGGRAWKFSLFPLVSAEIPDLDLLRIFSHGLIPSHYQAENPKRFLKPYIEDYLTQEIQAEGLVRNLPNFMRFMDSLRFCHGELINYSNTGRECYIDSKTVKEYFQILEDTLVGYHLYPYFKNAKRIALQAIPKFYLFDVGIANYIKKVSIEDLKGIEAGKSLEHLIFLELLAHITYQELDTKIHYWRTASGLEVDFVLGDAEIAIEVKISSHLRPDDLKGLKAFQEEFSTKRAILVCMEETPRLITHPHGKIEVIPVKDFLKDLWEREILS